MKNVAMAADPNVQLSGGKIEVKLNVPVRSATWLDCGEQAEVTGENSFAVKPFAYGTSYSVRVAKFLLK